MNKTNVLTDTLEVTSVALGKAWYLANHIYNISDIVNEGEPTENIAVHCRYEMPSVNMTTFILLDYLKEIRAQVEESLALLDDLRKEQQNESKDRHPKTVQKAK